ncbi:MAG: hypothetical protein EHM43_01335, partial [Ignavibacteriae bacterium]
MEHIVFSFTAGPWWAYLLLVAASAGIAVVAYQRTMPELSPTTKAALIILRTLGIALLLIALFEPVLRMIRSTERVPTVAIAVDESRSVVIGSTSDERRTEMLSIIEKIRSTYPDAELIGFGASARPLTEPDSLMLTGERTDPAT